MIKIDFNGVCPKALWNQSSTPKMLHQDWQDVLGDTVDSRYLKVKGTLRKTSRYPYFDLSDLQN